MIGRFCVSRMRFAHREAFVFQEKTLLNTKNRPRTITDVVCVTIKVTKTTSQAILSKKTPFIASKGYNFGLAGPRPKKLSNKFAASILS
jgi:hypothetical protein